MVLYRFRCYKCQADYENAERSIRCPGCGEELRWFGMVQRDREKERLTSRERGQSGYSIEPDRSALQQAYIETPEVQAKLKTGEYTLGIEKGSDAWNHAH